MLQFCSGSGKRDAGALAQASPKTVQIASFGSERCCIQSKAGTDLDEPRDLLSLNFIGGSMPQLNAQSPGDPLGIRRRLAGQTPPASPAPSLRDELMETRGVILSREAEQRKAVEQKHEVERQEQERANEKRAASLLQHTSENIQRFPAMLKTAVAEGKTFIEFPQRFRSRDERANDLAIDLVRKFCEEQNLYGVQIYHVHSYYACYRYTGDVRESSDSWTTIEIGIGWGGRTDGPENYWKISPETRETSESHPAGLWD